MTRTAFTNARLIDPAIADGPRSVITDQVEMGVAVRMAVLDALLHRAAA